MSFSYIIRETVLKFNSIPYKVNQIVVERSEWKFFYTFLNWLLHVKISHNK